MTSQADNADPRDETPQTRLESQASQDFGRTSAFEAAKPNADWQNEELQRVGRYIMLQRVGAGAFGIVYQARDESLARDVAIKLLTRFQSSRDVDAWLAEAQVLAKLDHPAIVPVYDIGKTPRGQPFIVSKFIDGGTLSDRLSKVRLSVLDSVKIIRQLADALNYLHGRGVMHRDIKPGNILVDAGGKPVLADFGLALRESEFGRGARFVGTPSYMSPEQARHEGHRVDGRSDIYSLGVVFYELLTGTRPFHASTQEELLDCIRNIEVRPPRQLDPAIPRPLESVCLRALAKKVTERYSTAADLVVDLDDWLTYSAHSQTALHTPAGSRNSTKPGSSSDSLDLKNVAVVPRGLRSFDSSDADFYRFLVPGAKDRYGIPASISFWKQRVLSRDPQETFRVGVLLGPSGSGKSSFMRAGLLPLVESSVHAVYVEAKSDSLEASLLKRVQGQCKALAGETSLLVALTKYRQQGRTTNQPKLVMVIDQFEQWLNVHRDSKLTELHEALRQCDGVHLQAILLVRDDFLLGLTGLMDQLDELLLQNKNFATIEAFGTTHAKNVLAAFGRAYGTIQTPPSADQELFLKLAVEELDRFDALAPVQIAILSEMIKDKPWVPETLRALGGTQGFGVSFLEDRLAGAGAHPVLRSELPTVKRILRQLLPSDDAVIKPSACPQQVLFENLGESAAESTILKLLDLLDTEVRLITPVGVSGAGSVTGSAQSEPAYQLTHDFLVPTTRLWLASQEQGTRSGRVHQQLRDLAAGWNAHPSVKKLPTLTEWASIRWFTGKTGWSQSERRMMRAAETRMLRHVSLLTLVTLLLLAGVYISQREIRVSMLATRLLEVDTSALPTILEQIRPVRQRVLNKLADLPEHTADMNGTERIHWDRHRLNIAVAKFDSEPAQAEFVLDHLDQIDVRHLLELIPFLSGGEGPDLRRITQRVREALAESRPQALPLAALLASRSPDNALWTEIVPSVTEVLLQKPSAQLHYWVEMLRPIHSVLLPELLNQGKTAQPEEASISSNRAMLVAAIGANDVNAMVAAMHWAPLGLLSELVDRASSNESLSVAIRQELNGLAQPRWQAGNLEITNDFSREIQPLGGHVFATCAWADQIPLEEVPTWLARAKQAGYGPSSVRPYWNQQQGYAAVTWTLEEGNADGKHVFEASLTQSQLQELFAERRSQGWHLLDFTAYDFEGSPLHWCGLWRDATHFPRTVHQRLLLGQDLRQVELDEDSLAAEDLLCLRAQNTHTLTGDLLAHRLYQEMPAVDFTSVESRLEYAFGDLYPANRITDIRCQTCVNQRDRAHAWKDFHEQSLKKDTGTESARDQVNQGRRLVDVGAYAEALQVLEAVTDERLGRISTEKEQGEVRRGRMRYLARAYAGAKRIAELERLLVLIDSTPGFTDSERNYLHLRLAVLQQQPDEVATRLTLLATEADLSAIRDSYYLESLAAISAVSFDQLSADALAKLLARVRTSAASGRHKDFASLLIAADFDHLREQQPWQTLLNDFGVSRRYTSASHYDRTRESRFTLAASLDKTRIQALRLAEQGFAPSAWDITIDLEGQPLASTAWQRATETEAEQARRGAQIARLAMCLALANEEDVQTACLSGKWGRTAQCYLATNASHVIPAARLVQALKSASDPSLQLQLVSAIGGYRSNQLGSNDLKYILLRLNEWSIDGDARLRSMCRWCLQHWGESLPGQRAVTDNSQPRDWYLDSRGNQYNILRSPDKFLVGRADQHSERRWMRGGRKYALAATEVSLGLFREFLQDPRMKAWINRNSERKTDYPGGNDLPATHLSWQHAIRFAQWMNEQEAIPKDQWCYLDAWSETPSLATNYLALQGYRLPTGPEWEWACGAGSDSAWHFGANWQLGDHYEWYSPESQERLHPLESLRPNDFGMFAMGGNAAEWCDNSDAAPYRRIDSYVCVDSGNAYFPKAEDLVVLHGGRYSFSVDQTRTNTLTVNPANYLTGSCGFRIARTMQD